VYQQLPLGGVHDAVAQLDLAHPAGPYFPA
jgi:hypothetical protein